MRSQIGAGALTCATIHPHRPTMKGYTMKTTTVTSHTNGTTFTVLFLDAFEVGPNRFRHTGEGLHDTVEFYDAAYIGSAFSEHGQFIADYNLSTIMENTGNGALCLQGGIPAWTIDADAMHLVRLWLTDIIAELNVEAEAAIDAKMEADAPLTPAQLALRSFMSGSQP